MNTHYLKSLFEPQSVALFGASEREGSVGAVVLHNLVQGAFEGKIFPINPNHDRVQGQTCYRELAAVHAAIDLAVVTTPAHTVPSIIEQCGQRGIRAAVVLSAGFREIGEQGRDLEDQVLLTARRYGLRLIGPNCLGIMRPGIGFNATFNRGGARAGKLALVSQSGALCTSILDWADSQGIGFSSVISTGISADIDFGEVLDYLLHDSATESILLYIEGVQNARTFMSGLRAAARVKPVMAVKVGRHQSGSRAAMSHTGALVGADDVFDAALRRAGVVRGQRINDLFGAATVLESGTRVRGERLSIVTNGGGPAAIAADRASDLAIPLATLTPATVDALNECLPVTWSHGNPVDIIGDATAERYAQAVRLCLQDGASDGVLVILTPQAMTDPLAVAREMAALAKAARKPLLTCWMGGGQVEPARDFLAHADIPVFRTPESAVEGFAYLSTFYRNQQLLLQTPGPLADERQPDIEGARLIIDSVLAQGRKVLTELESMALLAAFRIPTVHAGLARSPTEALLLAESLGFPVAMKVYAPAISHKSDVGGVRLGITGAAAVQQAYTAIVDSVQKHRPEAEVIGVVVERMYSDSNGRELLVGLNRDPVFGPVVTFGAGGTAVEVLRDRQVALPPLNHLLARDMISRTRIAAMLGAFRQMPPADLDAVIQVLLRVSEMACELPQVRELDINPLIVNDKGAVAVDARLVVAHRPAGRGRYEHMAIHPYPSDLCFTQQLPGGVSLTIRPIRPEDAEIEQAFVRGLSAESRYFRFMYSLKELTPAMLARFTQIDYDREMALIAVVHDSGGDTEIGVARYMINADRESCEFAIVVDDRWRRQGIAGRLMEQLLKCAREKGLRRMEGDVLADNKTMISFCETIGFVVERESGGENIVRVKKIL